MRKHLPRYDFLLYVDVDAVVMNFETGLEDIVDVDYDQVLAADSNGVNCGCGAMPARAACAFDSQPWFYEAGDFIIRLAELKGTVKCVVFARYYARARALMRAKGMVVAADVDVPPPSAWTCLTKNA
ncbi:hypothetical protein BE221DRAFT_143048 [Ostreococcus tauri]|uniref:Hexosyltransferase n=1 Tax=Ostreococcus tauri TaxID=70448 RepID=A0A1Y5HWP5_OSTTA|nr:hypothetical protein BE221DRAFT_143048 [Ostreococcus tauri]